MMRVLPTICDASIVLISSTMMICRFTCSASSNEMKKLDFIQILLFEPTKKALAKFEIDTTTKYI